ncbi:MAG: hypothetical protein ABI675_02815 [Chitinophagaceae bacterium]
MLKQIFETLDQVQLLQETPMDNKFSRECVAGNKVGILKVENIHPQTRDNKSVFISLQVEDLTYLLEGYIETNVLYFNQVVIPRTIFRENFLLMMLVEIIKLVRKYRVSTVVCLINDRVYFNRVSVPFRSAGFTRSRGTTGDFYSFVADYSVFLK